MTKDAGHEKKAEEKDEEKDDHHGHGGKRHDDDDDHHGHGGHGGHDGGHSVTNNYTTNNSTHNGDSYDIEGEQVALNGGLAVEDLDVDGNFRFEPDINQNGSGVQLNDGASFNGSDLNNAGGSGSSINTGIIDQSHTDVTLEDNVVQFGENNTNESENTANQSDYVAQESEVEAEEFVTEPVLIVDVGLGAA
jgi:hypothetical protein